MNSVTNKSYRFVQVLSLCVNFFYCCENIMAMKNHGYNKIMVSKILSRLREYHGCENFIAVASISRLREFYLLDCLSVLQLNHTNQFLG